MVEVRMHPEQVEAFCAGQLDEAGEEALAFQVAQILPYEPLVPNQSSVYLTRVVEHLGGEPQLIDWLARFPGEPCLVAATLQMADLLAALSGQEVIVDAIRQVRSTRRVPETVQQHLTPDTDHVTLIDLSEALLRRCRTGDAAATLELAVATLTFLDRTLEVAAALGGDVATAQSYAAQARRRVELAAVPPVPGQRVSG